MEQITLINLVKIKNQSHKKKIFTEIEVKYFPHVRGLLTNSPSICSNTHNQIISKPYNINNL